MIKNNISWFSPDKLEKDSLWSAVSSASKYAKGKLLDVGCGNKPYYNIFLNKVDSYIGLDLSGGDVVGSALNIPFSNSFFDTVLSTQVIEHIEKPQVMFQEINRVLKKNGHLILTAPLFWCLHEEPEDYFRFTKYSLSALLSKKNFKIIYIKERGNWLITLGQMISLFLESSFNRMLLKYPKRFLQFIIQYLCYRLSKIEKFNKNKQAPLGYIIVARKL